MPRKTPWKLSAHVTEHVAIDSDALIRQQYEGKVVSHNGEHERLGDALDALVDLAEAAVAKHKDGGYRVEGTVELARWGARLLYVPIKSGGGYEVGVPLTEALERLEACADAAERLFATLDPESVTVLRDRESGRELDRFERRRGQPRPDYRPGNEVVLSKGRFVVATVEDGGDTVLLDPAD